MLSNECSLELNVCLVLNGDNEILGNSLFLPLLSLFFVWEIFIKETDV